MAQINEVQRKWVDDFLGVTGRGGGTSELSLDGAEKRVIPTDGMAAATFTDDASGATIGVLAGAAGVLMAGVSSGDSNLPAGGSGNASGGSGGSAGSPSGGGGPPPPNGGGPAGGTPKGTIPYPGHGPTPEKSLRRPPLPLNDKQRDEQEWGQQTAERERRRQAGSPQGAFDPKALQQPIPVSKFVADDGGLDGAIPLDEDGNPMSAEDARVKRVEKFAADDGGLGGAIALGKDGNPISGEDLNRTTDAKLKTTLDAFRDGKKGAKLKEIKLKDKTPADLHDELIKKGFTLVDPNGRLEDFNQATGKMEYRLRDGSFTPDKNKALTDGVPHYVYVHKDGSMVRIKPEGNPDGMRNVPHTSKSVLHQPYDADGKLNTSWENEAFKVNDENQAVPKAPDVASGMRDAPRGVSGWEKTRTRAVSGKPPTDDGIQRTKGYNYEQMRSVHYDAVIDPQSGPAAPQGGSGPPKGPDPSAQVDAKAAQTFIRGAEDNKKLADDIEQKAAKGGAPPDTAKLQKQTIDLENEAEKLAKQLRAHPDLADIPGSTAKQFYSGVRAKIKVRTDAAGLVLLALDVADAYDLVQAVRYILDSQSVSEAVQESLQLGGDFAKETAKFAALKKVVGGPVAIGIMTFLGDLDKPGRLTTEEAFDNEIARVINEIRPGSVGIDVTFIQFYEPEAEKLYNDARQQAIEMWKDKIAEPATKRGLMDGLCGIETKPKFEVSKDKEKILSIDDKWLEQMYRKGLEQGNRKREDAMKRVVETGFNDGKAGKPSNFEAVRKWPELQVLIRRIKGKDEVRLSPDDTLMCQANLNEYERRYNLSYEKGYETAKR